jgi:hypothetical protein
LAASYILNAQDRDILSLVAAAQELEAQELQNAGIRCPVPTSPHIADATQQSLFPKVPWNSDWCCCVFSGRFLAEEIWKMNRHDQDLLDKQLRALPVAPRNDGVMILVLLVVFLSGMTVGGFLYAFTDQPGPTRIAMNGTAPVTALPNSALLIARQ